MAGVGFMRTPGMVEMGDGDPEPGSCGKGVCVFVTDSCVSATVV